METQLKKLQIDHPKTQGRCHTKPRHSRTYSTLQKVLRYSSRSSTSCSPSPHCAPHPGAMLPPQQTGSQERYWESPSPPLGAAGDFPSLLGASPLKNAFNTLHQKSVATLLLQTQGTTQGSSYSGSNPIAKVAQGHREGYPSPDQVVMEVMFGGPRWDGRHRGPIQREGPGRWDGGL